MLIALTTVWLVGLVVSYTDARLPPKFLKATKNIGKIYSTPYSYAVVPVPPKFVLHATVARKEVHVPVIRPVRRKRRPIGGRPYPPLDFVKGEYNNPAVSASQNHPRARTPQKSRKRPRPPLREQDYYEQEVYDEEEFSDYDDDRHYDKPLGGYGDRPAKRGYSSNSPKSNSDLKSRVKPHRPSSESRYRGGLKEYDDFEAQHSELHPIHPEKPKSRPKRVRDREPPQYSEFPSDSNRKPHPSSKRSKNNSRPSNKAYTTALRPPGRPGRVRDEDKYRHDEDEEEVGPLKGNKKRPKYPNEDEYEEEQYRDHDRDIDSSRERPSRFPADHEEYEFDPDGYYHDRHFEQNAKSKRGVERKRNSPPKTRLQEEKADDSEEVYDSREHDDHSGAREQSHKERTKDSSISPVEQSPNRGSSPHKETKWSIPFSPLLFEENWEHQNAKPPEFPPSKSELVIKHGTEPHSKSQVEKPVNEFDTGQPPWPFIAPGKSWNGGPQPSTFANNPHHDFLAGWQNFHVPQWPSADDQFGQFPESLHSTFKWVEPTNQTPLHPTTSTPKPKPVVVPPPEHTWGLPAGPPGETKKKKGYKRSKDRVRQESDIVDQRIVGSTLHLDGGYDRDISKKQSWAASSSRSSAKAPNKPFQSQYSVDTFKSESLEPISKPLASEIVYGSRISDPKYQNTEPDIGYRSGMETVEHDGANWQIYKKK